MKRKILAMVFVATMTMGLAKTAGSNDWKCITVSEECGPQGGFTAMICGSGANEMEIFIAQEEMLSIWFEIYGC